MYCAWYFVEPLSSVLPRATAAGSPNASRLRLVCVAPVASVVVPDHVEVLIDTSTSGHEDVVTDLDVIAEARLSESTARAPSVYVVAHRSPRKRYDVDDVRVTLVPFSSTS